MTLEVPPSGTDVRCLIPINATLREEPSAAVAELDKIRGSGEVEAFPLLLRHALDLVPDVHAAGIETRLLLLEIACNIFRDSESLAAIGWTQAWVDEADRYLGYYDIKVVAARRTLAHVLQLHGFLRSAARELDMAITVLRGVRADTSDRRSELCDLLVRRSSVEVAGGPYANLHLARTAVSKGLDLDCALLLPALTRNGLQLSSLQHARTRRRTIGGTRYVKGYDAALEQLVTSVESTAGATQYAVWDTIINAATRVGDTQTIRFAAGVVEQLPALPSSANLFARIQIRIDRAARTLAALADLRDIRVHVPYHPFRQPGLLPQNPQFLV